MVVRVIKNENYTVMSNHHLMNRNLSLKAKGLLSVILALPDDWEYSVAGLAAISREKETSINSALKELKENGYLVVIKKMPNETSSGRIEYEWNFFEYPCNYPDRVYPKKVLPADQKIQEPEKQGTEKQGVENLRLEVQGLENQGQLNTNIVNTNKENTNGISIMGNVPDLSPKCPRFVPPTVEQVREYCDERGNDVDPQHFVDYYTARGWKLGKNSVKDWKACVRTWERNSYGKPVNHTSNNFKSGGNEFTALLEQLSDEEGATLGSGGWD